MEELLNCIVAFINEVNGNPDSADTGAAFINLKDVFYDIELKKPNYLDEFDLIFKKDVQLYILVLSILFFVLKKEIFLEKVEKLCFEKELSYDQAWGIWEQSDIVRFCEGLEAAPYKNSREFQKYMVNRLKEKINFQAKSYQLSGGEQKNRILMVTNTLLSDFHAPTRMVLELCKTLQEEMGYEVFLLVCVEIIDEIEMEKMWLFPYHVHYDASYVHEFTREYSGVLIRGYQQVVSERHYHEIPDMFKKIEEWQPSCAWYIGGTSVIAELLQELMPVASMPCTNGYAVSAAPLLVSYMQNDKKVLDDMRQYISNTGQKTVDVMIKLEYKDSGNRYSAKDFGLPEDAFVIAVVGNRLDSEINGEFLAVMQQILEQSDRAAFVIIGEYEKKWDKAPFSGRVVNLGFCKDFYNVFTGVDLFLNPVRQGGGGGAACAIRAGVPVVTLGNCDAAYVGEEFVCRSLAEYPEIVQRYENDKAFYQKMSAIGRKRYFEEWRTDIADACRKVVTVLSE